MFVTNQSQTYPVTMITDFDDGFIFSKIPHSGPATGIG